MERNKLRKVVGLAAILSSVVAAGIVIGDYGVWEIVGRLSCYAVFYAGCIYWMLRDNKKVVSE